MKTRRMMVLAAGLVAAAMTMPVHAEGKKGTAVIKGKVVLDGTVTPPKIKQLNMAADAVCAKANAKPVADQGMIVYASEGNAVPYVFVSIKKGITDKYDVPATPIVIDQKGCVYHPHIMGMIAGQGIDIVNSDEVNHNIHSLAQKNPQFNFAQSTKGMKKELRGKDTFNKPETMAKIKCDVHGWMSSYVGVMTHPFFCVTKSHEDDGGNKALRGTFEIKELPAGKYEVEFWHETFGVVSQEVEVKDGETKEIEVKIGGKKAQAPTVGEEKVASMTSADAPKSCCQGKAADAKCEGKDAAKVDVTK